MAYREVTRVEIGEVIRRWQAGEGLRKIASGTGLSRITVRKYVAAAQELGLSREGAGPSEEQLNRLAGISQSGPRQVQIPSEEVLAPWADQVYQWLTGDRLQLTRIQELLAARGCRISYSSLHRWIRRRNWQRRQSGTVRMEDTAPGEVAELDFGRLGLIQDPETGRRRTAWALIVVLAYSRHSFVWPTFSQKLEDVIAGLEAAWAFFGGVPRYLVIDNFPRRGGGGRRVAPQAHPGLPGILPAPGRHHRPRPGETPQGQAPRGARRPVRAGAILQGQQLRQSGGDAIGCQAVVPGRSRIAGAWHHPAPAAAGLPG